MAIRPILENIIVKPSEVKEETSGGIILANPVNEGIIEAEVIAVGPGGYDEKGNRIPINVEVGDKILFVLGSGDIFDHDDKQQQQGGSVDIPFF
jgi:chaperonin GroES